MNAKVDSYLGRVKKWKEELTHLREILLECELNEDFKWGTPCYTFQDKNVALLGSFNNYCTLSFFKGALLKDPHGILRKPGENTRAARIIPFTGSQVISDTKAIIKNYLLEAIELEKAGIKVDFAETPELPLPEELHLKFKKNSKFKTAFKALTPGRQRGYLLFFSAAKQARTRTARIEKFTPRIFDGKGMNDCVCGRSKKMPNCDGSHKDA